MKSRGISHLVHISRLARSRDAEMPRWPDQGEGRVGEGRDAEMPRSRTGEGGRGSRRRDEASQGESWRDDGPKPLISIGFSYGV